MELKGKVPNVIIMDSEAGVEEIKSLVASIIGGNIRLIISERGNKSLDSTSIQALHFQGIDVQVYWSSMKDKMDLGAIVASCLKSDRPDGLIPTIVTDEHDVALGLVYSSQESVKEAINTRTGVYYSRNRGLWRKGETSGNVQELLKFHIDCDSDTLRFTVNQHGEGFCHLGTWGCFGSSGGLPSLMRTLQSRKKSAPPGSYTDRLYKDSQLLHSKILEEAQELCDAESKEDIAWEAADVMYFALAKCSKAGVSLADIEAVLDKRALKVKRRPGNAKSVATHTNGATKSVQTTHTNGATKPVAPETSGINKGVAIETKPVSMDTKSSMKSYRYEDLSETELQKLCRRPAVIDSRKLHSLVTPIIENVKKNGDQALLELTAKFDKVKLQSPVLDVPSASDPDLSDDVRGAIDLAYKNIYKFHHAQLQEKPLVVETCKGVFCSRHVRPVEKVGLYVPGGTAVLPSTALMLGIPAKVAGCQEIVMATPPRPDGTVSPEILYIAKKIGAGKILLAGGAQAVAAMAYGTKSVPKVDKICGPGNQFVTMAKMLVQYDQSACVSIDMPAGPSEIMVFADQNADASFVASDLLSQAEHGPDSQVVLVAISLSDEQLNNIQREIESQIENLPRRAIAREALSKSFVLRVSSIEDALKFSNMYAPEHLTVNTQNPESCLPHVQHAGSVFLGPYSPESCGDYASGTNHTLPTYGYARMYSGVSTATFQKHVTAQHLTKEGLANIGPAVATLAAVEKLDAHRNAVLIRLKHLK